MPLKQLAIMINNLHVQMVWIMVMITNLWLSMIILIYVFSLWWALLLIPFGFLCWVYHGLKKEMKDYLISI